VAVPPPTPVDVEALFAAATCYSALLTVYLLFTATLAMLKRSRTADEEATFVYSTNAIGGLSRGKRVVARRLRSGSMKQAVLLLLPLIAVYGVRHGVIRLSSS
jgi:TRAP-type C4-dicarboxylate transport system permease large subunit